jgi:hypothetical protein
MNLLLLAGNSLRNKPWIHEASEYFAGDFQSTLVHHYLHWETGEDFIDFNVELPRVAEEVTDFQPYSIFAKSVGSVLTIKGLGESKLMPHAVLITGLPLKVIQTKAIPIADWLLKIKVPVLIVQNVDDPLGSYKDVDSFIKHIGNQNVSVTSLPGDSHDYLDLQALEEKLLSLINTQLLGITTTYTLE